MTAALRGRGVLPRPLPYQGSNVIVMTPEALIAMLTRYPTLLTSLLVRLSMQGC